MLTYGERFRLTPTITLVVLMAAFVACARGADDSRELLVFVASSMTNAANEVGDVFERETGIKVVFNFGASQSLAQQVAQGAPADVILTAGRFPIDFLSDRKLVATGPLDLLSNTLVVVTREGHGEIESLIDLTDSGFERVAVANPDLAPAGRYAREALVGSGLWEQLQPKLIVGGNVRAALAYVETGNADAALVYLTDAHIADGVAISDVVPGDNYGPIRYPAAVLTTAPLPEEAQRFLEFLTGEEAQKVFHKHGFLPIK